MREAVRKLEALGLAVHVAHRGSRVKELDVDDLRDTYEARLALEPLAVARATGRITADEVERAQAALESYTPAASVATAAPPAPRTTRSTSRSTTPRARTGSCG